VAGAGLLYNRPAVGYALGLDLGTTFSGAAVARDGRAEMVSLAHNTSTVPSVLFLREDGTFLVGDAAVRRGLQDPGRLAREFKRRFGDTTPLLLGGSPWSADALYVQLLRHLLDAVAAQQGGPPDAITVTHPANWGRYKIDLLHQAVRSAGLGDAGLLTEPEAAAIHYASTERMAPGEIVAIYDLGGGTFDAAALRRTDAGFELLGTAEGIERLGGIDFDEAVLGHVVSFAGPALAELDPADPTALAALARLRAECVAAKEGLSEDTEVSIPVVLPTLQTQIRLTRAEFEEMVRPTLAETMSVLSRTLRSGGVEPDQVKAVLLVGGSSRIPLVGQLVAAEMGRPVAVDVHPKHAVALGAALHAAQGAAGQGAPAPAQPTVVPELPRTVPPPKPLPAPPAPAVPRAAAPAAAGGRRRLLVGGAAALVAVIVAAVLISSRGGGGSPQVKVEPEVPTFEVQDSVVSMASGAGALWLAGPYGLGRFDLATSTLTQSLKLGTDGNTRRVAFGAGVVWVTDTEAKTLARIDPATNTVVGTATLAGGPQDVLFAGDAIWVTLPDSGVVVRVDPLTQAITTIPVRGQPQNLAYGAGTLWVSDPGNRTVARVDPVRSVVTGDAAAGQCPDYVVANDTSVWVEDECEVTTVYRVDPSSGKVAGSVTVGNDAKGMVLAGGTLFVANATDNTVSLVDVASMSVRRTVRVGSSPIAFASAGGAVWVANQGDSTISRIDA
jgi:YVTN family beta-propeller protein